MDVSMYKNQQRSASEYSLPRLTPLLEEVPWSPNQCSSSPQDSLYQLLWPPRSSHRSTSKVPSMRDPTGRSSLCPLLPPLRKRKVRFAAFDRIREYERDDCSVPSDELWWSEEELAYARLQERISASADPLALQYVQAFRSAFEEISNHRPVSDENLFVLMQGCNLGFSGLMNTISKEWQYTRRLDVRCTIASVVNIDRRLRLLAPVGMDVADAVRVHYQTMNRPHRLLAEVMGHANCIALYIE
jgi:hypothetical protein